MERKISRERSLSATRLTCEEPIGTSCEATDYSLNSDNNGHPAGLVQAGLMVMVCAGTQSGSSPMRPSRRQVDELRAVSLERGVVKYAEGSCFVKFGATHVLVTATLEDRLPPWLKGQARGWVTAEYGMLPRATLERTRREASAGKQGGRTVEIQRLIGRSLRAVVDLTALGERQITVDCDVIQADGGTRTAAITGAWVGLYFAFERLIKDGKLAPNPISRRGAAGL